MASVLASGGPPVRGRAAIQKHYTGQGGPLSLRDIAYAAEGAVGYVIGGYTEPAGSREHFGALLLGTFDAKGDLISKGTFALTMKW